MPDRHPWRLRCPNGHADVTERKDDERHGPAPKTPWYCGTCKQQPGRTPHHDHVIDAKTGRRVTA